MKRSKRDVQTSTPRNYFVPYLIVGSLFALSAFIMYLVYSNLPSLEQEHRNQLKFPKSIEDASILYGVLKHYIEKNYNIVIVSFTLSFLFLQSFAIPGSIPMAVLGGALFKSHVAVPLICICTAFGSTICYMISYYFGHSFVHSYMPSQILWWRQRIEEHSSHLTRYIFILRLTPIFPGWFLNIAAPHINVPLKDFFIGSMFGIAPTTFIYSEAGEAIAEFTAGDASNMKIFTPFNLFILVCIGLIVALPSLLSKQIIKAD